MLQQLFHEAKSASAVSRRAAFWLTLPSRYFNKLSAWAKMKENKWNWNPKRKLHMIGVVAGWRDVGGGPSSYQPPTRLVSVGRKTKLCCWVFSVPTVILSTFVYLLSDCKGARCTHTFSGRNRQRFFHLTVIYSCWAPADGPFRVLSVDWPPGALPLWLQACTGHQKQFLVAW